MTSTGTGIDILTGVIPIVAIIGFSIGLVILGVTLYRNNQSKKEREMRE